MKFAFCSGILISVSLLSGCGEAPQNAGSQQGEANEFQADRMLLAQVDWLADAEHNKQTQLAIQKEIVRSMKANKAVEDCSLVSADDQQHKVVRLTFDHDQTTADQLMQRLRQVNPRKVNITILETRAYESDQPAVSDQYKDSESDAEATYEVDETPVEAPNLLQLFSRLFTR